MAVLSRMQWAQGALAGGCCTAAHMLNALVGGSDGLQKIADDLGACTQEAYISAQSSKEYQKATRELAKEWHKTLPHTPFQASDEKLCSSPDLEVLQLCNKQMQAVVGLKTVFADLYASSATFEPNEVNAKQRWGAEGEEVFDDKKWRPVKEDEDDNVKSVRQENIDMYKKMDGETLMHFMATTILDEHARKQN